jgi:hypothetical protein
MENRRQWEADGERIVEEMIDRCAAMVDVKMGAIQEDEGG